MGCWIEALCRAERLLETISPNPPENLTGMRSCIFDEAKRALAGWSTKHKTISDNKELNKAKHDEITREINCGENVFASSMMIMDSNYPRNSTKQIMSPNFGWLSRAVSNFEAIKIKWMEIVNKQRQQCLFRNMTIARANANHLASIVHSRKFPLAIWLQTMKNYSMKLNGNFIPLNWAELKLCSASAIGKWKEIEFNWWKMTSTPRGEICLWLRRVRRKFNLVA